METNGLSDTAELSDAYHHDYNITLADVNENGNKMRFLENMVMGHLPNSLHF